MSSDTIYSAVLDYQDHLKVKGYKDHTVNAYGRDLAKMYGYYGAYRKLNSITQRMVKGFFESDACCKGRGDQQLSRNTTDRTKRVCRHFLLWAHEAGRLDKLPLTEAEQRSSKPGFRFGSTEAANGRK